MSDSMLKQPDRTRPYLIATATVVVIALAIATYFRVDARQTLHGQTLDAAIPTVNVIRPSSGADGALTLPGRLQAWNEAPVFARTSGYIRKWYVDIGSPVKAGQVLADIEAPDLDQQLAGSKAALATAAANRKLAEVTEARWEHLLAENAVARQDADEKRSDLAAKVALQDQAAAQVSQLQAEVGFEHIVAPFDGTVTTRATDLGSLIVGGATNPTPLFTVSDTRRMRLYVSVPQTSIGAVRVGTGISFTVPEHPERTFTTTITVVANAVDPQSGAMLMQIQVNNQDGALKSGDYAQVSINLPSGHLMRVPPSALLFRKEGTAVAIVRPDRTVEIRPIKIGRDLGAQLEVASGLNPQDDVVDSPSDGLQTGDKVRLASRHGE